MAVVAEIEREVGEAEGLAEEPPKIARVVFEAAVETDGGQGGWWQLWRW